MAAFFVALSNPGQGSKARLVVKPGAPRALSAKRRDDFAQLIEKVRSQTRPYLKTSVKDQFQTIQQQLTPQERMLLVLYKYQGMNSQQVAEAMSSPDEIWTRTMVRKRWQRLKQKIADIAQQRGLLEQETDLPEQ